MKKKVKLKQVRKYSKIEDVIYSTAIKKIILFFKYLFNLFQHEYFLLVDFLILTKQLTNNISYFFRKPPKN